MNWKAIQLVLADLWQEWRAYIFILIAGIAFVVFIAIAPETVQVIFGYLSAGIVALAICGAIVIAHSDLRDRYRQAVKRLQERESRKR